MKQDTESPVWNETFTLYVQSPHSAVLHLNASDRDIFSADDNLGQGVFRLKDLLQTKKEKNKAIIDVSLNTVIGTATETELIMFLADIFLPKKV